MEIGAMLKAKKAWDTINRNHPKLAPFLANVKGKGVQEGMEIAVAVRWPDGTEHKAGVRLQASDIEALSGLKGLK